LLFFKLNIQKQAKHWKLIVHVYWGEKKHNQAM